MNAITSLNAKQLRRAATIQERIEALTNDLNRLLSTSLVTFDPAEKPTRRRMTVAGRKAISAAARARWAKVKGNGRRRRKMSPEMRARMAAVARERWRKAKAQGKGTL